MTKKDPDKQFDDRLAKIAKTDDLDDALMLATPDDEYKIKIENMEKEMKKNNFIETIKTIVITALVAAVVAFICGVQYQKSVTNDIQQQAKELTAVVTESKQ